MAIEIVDLPSVNAGYVKIAIEKWEFQDQWEFQDPKMEVPTIYKAYVRPL